MTSANSNQHFQLELETSAPASEVWRLWTDVSTWGDWDMGLRSATSDQPFARGTKGTIIDNSGRSSPFTVTECEPERTCTFVTHLPLGSLSIRRTITTTEPCRFHHDVSFHGIGGWVLSHFLAPNFRKLLPQTMSKLAKIAEQSKGTAADGVQ